MDYQNYEDYMRSVLGYKPMPKDIYSNPAYNNANEYYYMPYDMNYNMMNMENLNNYYPDTYRMIYPMVCRECNKYANSQITNEMLENMVNNIYSNLENTDNRQEQTTRQELRNGDVRNPNAKQETKQTNYLLRDLIKILLIRELLKINRKPPCPTYMRRPFGWYDF